MVVFPDAGALLDQALTQAGIRRQDVNITNVVPTQPAGNDFSKHSGDDVAAGLADLAALVRRLKPNLIVTLGNESSFAAVPGWPSRSRSIFGATGISERRGYLWEGIQGTKVLSTLHPEDCITPGYTDKNGKFVGDPSGIN